MVKGCALSTGYLPRGGLPRNSVDRLTDRPDMTSAVDRGRKASTQTNKQKTRKLAFCKWKTKMQISFVVTVNYCEADQRLFLLHRQYNFSSFEIQNFKPLAIFCGCTARFVSDLVGISEDRFFHVAAQILKSGLSVVMPLNDADRIADSANLDQTAPLSETFFKLCCIFVP